MSSLKDKDLELIKVEELAHSNSLKMTEQIQTQNCLALKSGLWISQPENLTPSWEASQRQWGSHPPLELSERKGQICDELGK